MDLNWNVIAVVGLVVLLLIVVIIRKNRKDRKNLEKFLRNDYMSPLEEESELNNEDR